MPPKSYFDATLQPDQFGSQLYEADSLIEAECYDDRKNPRGFATYRVREALGSNDQGAFFRADLLGCSDGYYENWASEDP